MADFKGKDLILSAANISAGSRLETDLVVIGGDAAEIAIAKRLAGSALPVVALESGGKKPTPLLKPFTAAQLRSALPIL